MRFLKKTEPIHILFCISSIVAILIATFFERKLLMYVLPIVIISIGMLYIKYLDKIDYWYLISLTVIIVCDILIYLDFLRYFSIICALISIYFLLCTVVLRKFIALKELHINTLFTVPILVSVCLIAYVIYSILELILHMVSDAIPYVLISIFSLLIYMAVSYFIYITDRYKGGLKLFIVGCLCMFIVSLLSINELLYYNTVFTVLITITHILGFYIFLSFLVETKPEDRIGKHKKYL